MGPRSSRTSNAEHVERAGPLATSAPPPRAGARITRRTSLASLEQSSPPPAALSPATLQRERGEHDMRRKRPPAVSFLLQIETARRVVRILSLLALDFAGVALAIFTALALKALVLGHLETA